MSKRRPHRQKVHPKWWILPAIGLAIVAVLVAKPRAGLPADAGLAPDALLGQALTAGRPVLVFYHSLDCRSCVEMMGAVAEVYPEFKAAVDLVDVNVYDPSSEGIIRWGGIRYVPTLVFVDRDGGREVQVGTMSPEALRRALAALGP
jgi:hypothetical protein